jgi:hypothetical protein
MSEQQYSGPDPPRQQVRDDYMPEPTTWRYRAGQRAQTLLLLHPRLTWLVRWLLQPLARDAQHAYALHRRRLHDAQDNTRYAVPDDETPRLAAVWTVELYTPSSITGLLNGLRRHDWLRSGSGDDPGQWVLRWRRNPGFGGIIPLTTIVPPNSGMGPGLGRIGGDVPDGFKAIKVTLLSVTSTITGAIACFVPTDELAMRLAEELRREQQSAMPPSPSGGWWIHDVPYRKAAAADTVRQTARGIATRWMSRYLPGMFAGGLLEGAAPTLDLLLLETVEPLAGDPASKKSNCGWLELLGLDTSFDAWVCQDVPGLKLTVGRPYRTDDATNHRYHLTLAAQRRQLFSDDELDDPKRRAPWELIWRLDSDYLPAFATRWAVSGLLSGVESRLARIRDLAEQSSHRRSTRMLNELRGELLTVGLDGHIVAADVMDFTSEVTRYDREVATFVETWTPAPPEVTRSVVPNGPLRPERRTPAVKRVTEAIRRLSLRIGSFRTRQASDSEPSVTLSARLREGQHERAEQILDDERQLRDVLVTTSNLAGAVTNLRLQIWVAVLAIISTIATVLALYLSITREPATAPTSVSTSTSLPASRTSRS